MSEPMYKKDESGEWVKVIKSISGEEHEITLTDGEKAQLDEKYNTTALIKTMTKDDLEGLIRRAKEVGALEQQRKDELTRRESKSGGGVISLQSRNLGTPSEATLHREVSDELDRLRRLEEKGDKVSSRKLSELYSIAMRKIKGDKDFRLLIQACPSCQRGINMLTLSDGARCPYCSFDFQASGYEKFAELYNREVDV